MEWTATLGTPEYTKGNLRVVVTFSKGETSFDQTFQVFKLSRLDEGIKGRLRELAELDQVFAQLVPGPFVPLPEVEEPVDEVAKALTKVNEGHSQLERKLITQEEYDLLVAEYKALVSK